MILRSFENPESPSDTRGSNFWSLSGSRMSRGFYFEHVPCIYSLINDGGLGWTTVGNMQGKTFIYC